MAERVERGPLFSLTIRDMGEGHLDEGGRFAVQTIIDDQLEPIEMVDMALLAMQAMGEIAPQLREMVAMARKGQGR